MTKKTFDFDGIRTPGLHTVTRSLKILPIGCPEMSVTYYQSTLRNILEERREPDIIRQENCVGEINYCQMIFAKERMS